MVLISRWAINRSRKRIKKEEEEEGEGEKAANKNHIN